MLGTGTHFFPRNFRQSVISRSNPTHPMTVAIHSAQLPNSKQKQNFDINNNSIRNYKRKQLRNILRLYQQKISFQPKTFTASKGKRNKKYLCVKGFQKQPLNQIQQQKKKRITESSFTNRILYKHNGSFCWNKRLVDKPKTAKVVDERLRKRQTNYLNGWDTIDDDFDIMH